MATETRTAPGPGIDEVFVEAVAAGDGSRIRSPYGDAVKSLALCLPPSRPADGPDRDPVSLYSDLLAERERRGRPVRVAVIGAGKFGGAADRATGADAGHGAGRRRRSRPGAGAPGARLLRPGGTRRRGRDRDRRGRRRALRPLRGHRDPLLAAACPEVDVVVEATGAPEAGARHALAAVEAGRHVVMVNVEADVTVGALLKRRADAAGVVYTLVDGDQPGCIMDMVEWARTLGFEIVAAGRGTVRYADDSAGTPDSVQDRYGFDDDLMERRTINTRMFNSFRDGTKAQVEMTALANMTGLPPDVRGMHEPSVNVEEIPRRFSRREEGGLLGRSGVVELANSVAADGRTMLPDPLGTGVFCVIRAEHPFVREDLAGYHCHAGGDGRNFLLWRPYHLVAVEAPLSIARAALYQRPTGAPRPRPVADTVTVAKRDLATGEVLDGGGGYTVNGVIETAEAARAEGLPAPRPVVRGDAEDRRGRRRGGALRRGRSRGGLPARSAPRAGPPDGLTPQRSRTTARARRRESPPASSTA